jgi:signal transduction histidine kinase
MNWKVEEMLDLISNAVNYSNRIITDLLDYSRELTLDLHETTIRQLTKQAISLIEVPENVKIVDFTSDEPKLIIDPAMVQRIFVNVIKNSIDAMSDGGQITISDRIVDDRVELEFKDTGRGFTQESLKEIWKPFKTSKARGLGLGLAISKRIVEAHQGSVSVESDLGKGTTIIFTFPIKPKE